MSEVIIPGTKQLRKEVIAMGTAPLIHSMTFFALSKSSSLISPLSLLLSIASKPFCMISSAFSGLILKKIYVTMAMTIESQSMVNNVSAMLSGLNWNEDDVAEFLGEYLSEPKLQIVFDKPKHINEKAFAKKLVSSGIQLDLKSQLLFSNQAFYLNGERFDFNKSDWPYLLKLADERALTAEVLKKCSPELIGFMYAGFLAGYLTI